MRGQTEDNRINQRRAGFYNMLLRTFFEARMSAKSDLLPYIAHSLGASYISPVVQKVADFNLENGKG